MLENNQAFQIYMRGIDNKKPKKRHRMPESLSAFCRIVSLTAAKTSLIFVVSVACVKL